ncbi:hypothetical protein Tco_1536007, partial [Tanacetum coccineum]
YVILFLKEHKKEVYSEVRASYTDTMNKIVKLQPYVDIKTPMKHVFSIKLQVFCEEGKVEWQRPHWMTAAPPELGCLMHAAMDP